MRDLKTAFFIARCELKKWRTSSTVWSMAFLWGCLMVYFTRGITEFCFAVDMRVTPWAFPFLLDDHSQMIMYVALLIILFAHAPFCSQQTPFTLIRSGKLPWFWGQMLYIVMASLIAPLYTFGVMLLTLLPRLGFSTDWGGVLRSLALDSELLTDRGISTVIRPSNEIIQEYTAIEATVQTLLMLWLLGILLGTVILLFNLVIRPGAGIVAAACMGAWSFFTVLGIGVYGEWIQSTAICLWYSLYFLKPVLQVGVTLPVAVAIQLGIVLVCFIVSTLLFCRRDTVFETDE